MQRDASSLVVVLGTGGTISGSAGSPEQNLGYVAGTVGVDALVASAAPAAALAIETEQVAQLDSKDMDLVTWRRLAQRVAHHAARTEVRGIVVTHGTDTMEETAYFLSRIVAVDRPVILTGAMRPATSSQADGPRNLAEAIAVAGLGAPAGVAVAFAGALHAARHVRKVHPTRLDAFSSGEAGPLARIVGGRLEEEERPAAIVEALGIDVLPGSDAWPWVEIVASGAASDGRAVEALVDAGVDGLVVAATGNGSLHRALEPSLAAAASCGVAVLRCTRCLDGAILEDGRFAVESAVDLTPQKARVELMLRLLQARRRAAAG